ncbi:MAG: hypothetical protein AAB373_04690 [Patescibacteria group bacterium]
MIDDIRKHLDLDPTPTTRGEEGVLYRVSAGEESFFAKRWYRSHEKQGSFPIEAGGAALSPFWHNVVRLKQEIVHALFPGYSIKTVGSFDERVKRGGGEGQFDLDWGRPVTVSKEVVGDPVISPIRTGILDAAYKTLLAHKDDLMRRGAGTKQEDPFFKQWTAQVNREIVGLLGPDIDLGASFFEGNRGFDDIVCKLQRQRPGSMLTEFFEAGISVAHPEVNFIPGNKDTHQKKPHGTFLEFNIGNEARLKHAIMRRFKGDQSKINELLAKLRSYQINQLLDKIFDHILPVYIKITDGQTSPISLSAIYTALERFKIFIEQGKLTEEITKSVVEGLISIINTSGSHERMAWRLQEQLTASFDYM